MTARIEPKPIDPNTPIKLSSTKVDPPPPSDSTDVNTSSADDDSPTSITPPDGNTSPTTDTSPDRVIEQDEFPSILNIPSESPNNVEDPDTSEVQPPEPTLLPDSTPLSTYDTTLTDNTHMDDPTSAVVKPPAEKMEYTQPIVEPAPAVEPAHPTVTAEVPTVDAPSPESSVQRNQVPEAPTEESSNDTGKPKDTPEKKESAKRKSRSRKKTGFWLITPIVILIIFMAILGFTNPGLGEFFAKAFVTLILGIFLFFLALGIFVVIGLRDQVKNLLSIIFEGGMKYIDMAEFFSALWDDFIRMVQEIILFIAPFLAVLLAIFFYFVVMYTFRFVAVENDVTTTTIAMTVALASFTALLGMTNLGTKDDIYSFRTQLSYRFGRVFIDGVEIVVVVIFLTIDVENLFFLPEWMHGPVYAEAFGIDLMQRGIDPNGFVTTLRIAGFAVFVEIVRKIYRMVAAMIIRYNEFKDLAEEEGHPIETQQEMFELLRRSSRMAFKDNLDDLTKFLGFTTVLIVVFLFFPRLKLVSLLVYNLTNLFWDFMFPSRTVRPAKSEDLISRLIAKTFKL